MTTVISLLGGPGSGKSTLAAQLFADLKQLGCNCELVKEYVKDWAWSARHVGEYDQPLIAGKQMHRESSLYGKVDVIVTDSPFILSGFYQQLGGQDYVNHMLFGFKRHAEANGVNFRYYYLERSKSYNPAGRYQTEEEAKELDVRMREWLDVQGVQYSSLYGYPLLTSAVIIGDLMPEGSIGETHEKGNT